MKKNKVILTDADGVILDWEWAFNVWVQEHGFALQEGFQFSYSMQDRYGISADQVQKLIKIFNESAAIGFLPPLRDSMYYVKRLHEEHGFSFHCITSLSKDENAQKLRQMNLQKLFGKTVFDKMIFLDTGAPKHDVLENYRGKGHYWIEDQIKNAEAGESVGLKTFLMEHGHNLDYSHPNIQVVKNWKDIYDRITK